MDQFDTLLWHRRMLQEELSKVEEVAFVIGRKQDRLFTLHYWHYGAKSTEEFLTLEDAQARAEEDLWPEQIVGPGGVEYPKFGEDE